MEELMKCCDEITTPSGQKYRYFLLGFRRLVGSDALVQQGAIIEKLEQDKWVYDSCMHPDDVLPYINNLK